MKKTFTLILTILLYIFATGQTVSPSAQIYSSGDGNNWYLTGTGNGPMLMLRQHSGLGGPSNRRGSLGWMDNNGIKAECMTWADNGYFGIGSTNPLTRFDVYEPSASGRVLNIRRGAQSYASDLSTSLGNPYIVIGEVEYKGRYSKHRVWIYNKWLYTTRRNRLSNYKYWWIYLWPYCIRDEEWLGECCPGRSDAYYKPG